MNKSLLQGLKRAHKSSLVFLLSFCILSQYSFLPKEWKFCLIFFTTFLSYFNMPLMLLCCLWGAGFLLPMMTIRVNGTAAVYLNSIPLFYFILLFILTLGYVALKFEPDIRERLSFVILLCLSIPAVVFADSKFLAHTPAGTLFVLPLALMVHAALMTKTENLYAGVSGALITAVLARGVCLKSAGMFISHTGECAPFFHTPVFPSFLSLKHFLSAALTFPVTETLNALIKYFFSSFHILFQCACWGAAGYVCAAVSKPSFLGRITAFSSGCAILLTSYYLSNFLVIRQYPSGLNYIFLMFAAALLIYYCEDLLLQSTKQSKHVSSAGAQKFPAFEKAQNIKTTNKPSPASRFNMVEPLMETKKEILQDKIPVTQKALRETVEEMELCLKSNPADKDLLFSLGEAQYKLGDFPSARETFTKIIELDPNNEAAHTCLSMIQYDEKRGRRL